MLELTRAAIAVLKRPFALIALGLVTFAGYQAAIANTNNQLMSGESPSVGAARLEADVRFLASDLLEGREAGTRGYELAATFVAERYRALGLNMPEGQNNYFQQVPMRGVKSTYEFGGELTFSGENAPAAFMPGTDFVVRSGASATQDLIEAPIVFVGFGLVAPKYGRDDYEGLDVEGKIVAYLYGAPKFLNSEERAYHSGQRAKNASDRGAIGTITLYTPTFSKRLPFERLIGYVTEKSRMFWMQPDGTPYSDSPGIRGEVIINMAGAEKLFSKAPVQWDAIAEGAESEQGLVKGFEWGVNASIEVGAAHRESQSPNVIGVLEGSDPTLKNEYVVLSAHLDHEGIHKTDEEGDDEIYNGAMDNATGVSSMLEVARMLSLNPPKRSVMFIALTGEEKGLLGSEYFAKNPIVPIENIVANVNLDMPILTYDFTDVVAYGAERSTLFSVVEQAAKTANLTLSPDPVPELGIFTRSDHYSFVAEGVPAVYLDLGFASGGEEAQNDFMKHHYHERSDEAQLISYDVMAKFVGVNFLLAQNISNMKERPVWKRGDFFGETFKGPMEK